MKINYKILLIIYFITISIFMMCFQYRIYKNTTEIKESQLYQEYMLIPEEYFFNENKHLVKNIKSIEDFVIFNRNELKNSFNDYKKTL